MQSIRAHNLKIRNLQYILAVVQTGSFTRAAELCNVTQSTLSSGIKETENILQNIIFDRSNRDISLTAFGEKIISDIEDILDKAAHILALSQTDSGHYVGPFRLGVIPTIAPYFLPKILPQLKADFPDIEIILNENISEVVVDRVRRGQIDAAILAFPYDVDGLASHILFDEAFYLLRQKNADPQNLDSQQVLVSDDIDVSDLLLLDDGHCLRDHALAVCAKQDPNIRQTFRATSLTTLVQMVRHGYGTTLLPEMAVQEIADLSDLQAIPIDDDASRRKIGMIWRPKSPLLDLINAMMASIDAITP